ncbi:hypothetical protein ACNJYA_09260 [Bradyrhizobium sp. DASA03068]|uniref:hypothetical protein n=1 Tax=Bradyrhizobium sp. BLXBL-01 TaxID=3395915 RepID=UPI003F705A26
MSVETHADILDRQFEDLGWVEKLIGELPEDDPLRQAASLRPVVNLYATRFGNVVSAQRNLGFNENDGFQGKLRIAVHAFEERLSQVKQPRLTILMLMMRRHEKDFILRGEERYGDQLPPGRWSSKPNLLRQAYLRRRRNPSDLPPKKWTG